MFTARLPLPSFTTTRFGTFWLGPKFRSEANGRGVTPAGQIVKKLSFVPSVAVTLRMAAVALAGTPPKPATGTVIVPSGPIVSPDPVGGGRVSLIRTGVSGVKKSPVAVASV